MAITLAGIQLHKDMEWQDEFSWSPTSQTSTVTLDGSVVFEESTQQSGRFITLFGGDDACWTPRSTIKQLHALLSQPGTLRELNYHGDIYNVLFRHAETPIEAKQVQRIKDPGDEHLYTLTLKLVVAD